MTQTVYEQALKDSREYIALAERSAQEKLLRATLPKIRSLIEQEIVGASDDEALDADIDMQVTEPDANGDVTLSVSPTPAIPASALSQVPKLPAQAPATVPAIPAPPPPAVPSGRVTDAQPVLTDDGECHDDDVLADAEQSVNDACAEVKRIVGSRIAQRSPAFGAVVREAKTKIADIYTQINGTESLKPVSCRLKEALEKSLAQLALREIGMKNRDRLTENDVSLTLTGMPDELDLSGVGVEIEAGDDDGDDTASDDGESAGDGDEGGDALDLAGGDDDASDEDAGDDDGDGKSEAALADDDVLEIDEGEIRAELRKLRAMREAERVPDVRGNGPGDADNFGNGSDEGDPLDTDIVTETSVRKLQLVKERALRTHNVKLYRECVAKIAKLTRETPARQSRAARPAARAASAASPRRVTESASSRAALETATLHNAQLALANKLLLRDDLTAQQKKQALVKLSESKTVREAKIIFESISEMLRPRSAGSSLNESRSRRPAGSSSSTARSGASTISEGVSAARWSKLAGLTE